MQDEAMHIWTGLSKATAEVTLTCRYVICCELMHYVGFVLRGSFCAPVEKLYLSNLKKIKHILFYTKVRFGKCACETGGVR